MTKPKKKNFDEKKVRERLEKCRGRFAVDVLLSDPSWDCAAFLHNVKEEFGRELSLRDRRAAVLPDGNFATSAFGPRVSITLHREPVQELIERAVFQPEFSCSGFDWIWPGAGRAARLHRAYLHVEATAGEGLWVRPRSIGTVFACLVSSLCSLPNALAVLRPGCLQSAEFWQHDVRWAGETDLPPVHNWVRIGVIDSPEGFCAFTTGMTCLGLEEMETVGTDPDHLRRLLFACVLQTVLEFVPRHDGEVVSLAPGDRHRLERRPGRVPGETVLRIEFGKGLPACLRQ